MAQDIKVGQNAKIVKPIIFRLTKKNTNPATEGRFYPGLKRIPSTDTIFEDGASKTIRYSASEESIYKNEQPSHVELTDIIFTNGALRVYEDNPTLIEFLRKCNWNRDNDHRVRGKRVLFYEYNPAQVAQDTIKNEELEIDARYKAMHMPFNDLLNVARALGRNTDMTPQEIRYDMIVVAKTAPRAFIEAMDNPFMQRKAEVVEAIELDILAAEKRGIFMATPTGNKEQVLVTPVGRDPLDVFVEYTLENKDGEELWKDIANKKKKILE